MSYWKGNRKNNTVVTPQWIIDFCEKTFNIKFDHDPCPVDQLNKEGEFVDSLLKESEWGKTNFVNPPYVSTPKMNNGIKGFLTKALEEFKKKKSSVFLIPYTQSKYFMEKVWPNYDKIVILPNGFVRFLHKNKTKYKNFFPRPLCIVFFNGEKQRSSNNTRMELIEVDNGDKKKQAIIFHKIYDNKRKHNSTETSPSKKIKNVQQTDNVF